MDALTDGPIFAVILAGGAGTRFWPASRPDRPKQLLPLGGDEPLLSRTIRRILPVVGDWQHVLVASGRRVAAPTAALLPELPATNLLIEPVPRNTAPCIGWAAARIARRAPDAVVAVLPSDHHVADEAAFVEVVRRAVASARSGTITTIGIRPTRAETGFGWLELERPDAGGEPQRVVRFVEKPDRARAEAFVAGGRHLWNAGMFFFRAGDMLAAIRAHLPALAEGLDEIDAAARRGHEDDAVDAVFPGLPSVSIDHGVMEHVGSLAVVPGDFGWSDVGSWKSAWELAAKDDNRNAAPAQAVLTGARDNLVLDLRTDAARTARTIALVGVDGLAVVETDDALLIVPLDRSQDVRDAVAEIERRERSRGG